MDDESIFKALLGSLIVKHAVESAAMSHYYGFTVYFRFKKNNTRKFLQKQ